jgi:hypothetical protein
MTKTILFALLATGAALAVPQASGTAASSAPQTSKTKPAAAQPLTIPSRAVKQPDGSYRFVDQKGKAWIYQQTPFGVSRAPETSAAASSSSVQTPFGVSRRTPAETANAAVAAKLAVPEKTDARTTAVADGDMIRFERPTPFGKSTWKKSKSDLTPEEQRIWDREQAKRKQ